MLRDADGDAVSGEEMADDLGVSRVAVAKHVASLRKAGYDIEAVVGEGYRLLAVPDAPLPAEVSLWLASELWGRLEGGGETGSTNDDARALAREGAAEGTVVLASRQTLGRGRLGRTWESPEGGAYFSAVMRPQVAPSRVASLALAVALGVSRGLESLGVASEVKWPNDVFAAGGKMAGVLLEMTAEADRVDWVVVGIGVNVRAPESRVPGAAYLDDIYDVPVARAVAAILDGVASAYADWRGPCSRASPSRSATPRVHCEPKGWSRASTTPGGCWSSRRKESSRSKRARSRCGLDAADARNVP
jgi:BirA family biotin operon repressor/biotin-[acetyl-CoA-carboxylase] ligase